MNTNTANTNTPNPGPAVTNTENPVAAAPAGSRAGAGTTPAGRLAALGRAELTLLVRNRTALFVALLMPVAMVGALRGTLGGMDLAGAGLSIQQALVTGGVGMVLILVVYLNLTSAFVARREELVLKRLRTGEVSDMEIIAGTALPAAALAIAQSALVVVAGVVVLGADGPRRPELLVAGTLLGTVVMTALAAATSAITRTVESAQITTLPLFMVSAGGSGLFIPLDVLPERVASVCELLPMTGVMRLVEAGVAGGADAAQLTGAALNALAWTMISVFAVRRWFRWEPRR
ncbi:ABC transporter permease [Streptomyces wuyuanensis]|uniref:Transport permease protein n=1 Tax=Streptomyces wuyuanensis TaxID=1196353 RepID=A0A1G9UBM3_9ACTN|nr:ABC-2 type transport system permease protein [Streptomyces wuyuanensis]